MPESTNVMDLHPQPWRILATAQPRVPAPRRRHLALATWSTWRSGRARHLMSFRFKSMAAAALCLGSNVDARLTLRGPVRHTFVRVG